MKLDRSNNPNKIKVFRTITDELFRVRPEDEIIEALKKQIKEEMLLNLDRFMNYQFEQEPLKKEFTVRGFVSLARAGQWEEDNDEVHAGRVWHHCNICSAEADEDAAGSEMLTAYCSRCGSYLGGDYD